MRGGLVSRYTHVDGVRWHVRTGGPLEGPPLVMLHGLSISSRYFVPFARLFVRDHRVYLPDLPGFGRSAKPALDDVGEVSVPRLADQVARWMDAEGVAQAAFVGNSLGCQIIVDLAARKPARVERALLIGPGPEAGVGLAANAWRLLLDAPRESPLLLLEHALDDLKAGPRRTLATARASLAYPTLERARSVPCPVLLVRGTQDPVVSPAWARRLAEALPVGRLVEIAGPHALNYSAPERLADAAWGFLASSRSASFPTQRAAALPLDRPRADFIA